MLLAALIILAAAGVGGAGLALAQSVPTILRMVHGTMASIGLIILLIAAIGANEHLVWTALGLMLVGFVAGAVLFGVVFTQRKPPGLVIAGHGLLNTIGVLLLAWAALYPG